MGCPILVRCPDPEVVCPARTQSAIRVNRRVALKLCDKLPILAVLGAFDCVGELAFRIGPPEPDGGGRNCRGYQAARGGRRSVRIYVCLGQWARSVGRHSGGRLCRETRRHRFGRLRWSFSRDLSLSSWTHGGRGEPGYHSRRHAQDGGYSPTCDVAAQQENEQHGERRQEGTVAPAPIHYGRLAVLGDPGRSGRSGYGKKCLCARCLR